MSWVKTPKLNMTSPVHQEGGKHKGGLVSPTKSPKLQGKKGGKGTQSHFKMEGPDLTGGGWSTGK